LWYFVSFLLGKGEEEEGGGGKFRKWRRSRGEDGQAGGVEGSKWFCKNQFGAKLAP